MSTLTAIPQRAAASYVSSVLRQGSLLSRRVCDDPRWSTWAFYTYSEFPVGGCEQTAESLRYANGTSMNISWPIVCRNIAQIWKGNHWIVSDLLLTTRLIRMEGPCWQQVGDRAYRGEQYYVFKVEGDGEGIAQHLRYPSMGPFVINTIHRECPQLSSCATWSDLSNTDWQDDDVETILQSLCGIVVAVFDGDSLLIAVPPELDATPSRRPTTAC